MAFAITFITGASMVLMGFLVKKYPDLIAGYNTMSRKQKAKVDIEGLSTMMRNGFIIMGALVILSYPLMSLLVLKQHVIGAMISIILFGVFVIVILAQKFRNKTADNRQRKSIRIISISVIFGIIIFSVFGLLYYGTKQAEIKIFENQLTISGIYGLSAKVEHIELTDSIPKILKRTDGFAYGETLKGNFKLEKFGKSSLFLESLNGPFIIIKTKREATIIINTKTKRETEALFQELETGLEE